MKYLFCIGYSCEDINKKTKKRKEEVQQELIISVTKGKKQKNDELNEKPDKVEKIGKRSVYSKSIRKHYQHNLFCV